MTFSNAPSTSNQFSDPVVGVLLSSEAFRQSTRLCLVASENFASLAVREVVGSVLVNRAAEGYVGARYFPGCEDIDALESLAIERARELFGAEHVNVQPHSGSNANLAAYMAVLPFGGKVLAMDLAHGGHFTHGSVVNYSGQLYNCMHYGVRPDTQRIDYDQVRDIAVKERPDVLVAGASSYPRKIDFQAFRSIADEVNAVFIADMAHYFGLIAGRAYPSPVEYADIVTSTTYKVLRGPRGGIILCKRSFASAVDRAVFPGVQGGLHANIVAAKAVALGEASSPQYCEYTRDVVAAARVLAKALASRGFNVVTGGTDCHLVLVDLSHEDELTGLEAQRRLEAVGILSNKNLVPYDLRPPAVTSGLRFGTAAMVTLGLRPTDFEDIAELVVKGVREPGGSHNAHAVTREVAELLGSVVKR